MKIWKQVDACDYCQSEVMLSPCKACSKLICDECIIQGKGRRYAGTAYYIGNDAVYCQPCDQSQRDTELHRAYRDLDELRKENETWYAQWMERAKNAERRLAKLLGVEPPPS